VKVKIISAAKATLLIFILAGLAFWMKDAGDSFLPAFQTSEVVEVSRFEKVRGWIPWDSEFFFAMDVDQALANEKFKEKLAAFAKKNDGVFSDLLSAMLSENGLIRMLVVLGKFEADAKRPELVVIAQGEFADNDFIAALKRTLDDAGTKIEKLQVAGRTLLSDLGDRSFALTELDEEHIIVGESGALSSYLERADKKAAIEGVTFSDAPLFGRLIIGERFQKIIPDDFVGIDRIEFSSKDGKALYAEIPCKDSTEALKLKVFLMGAKSVLRIRAEGNESLRRLVEDTSVGGGGSTVLLSIKTSTLLDLL